MPETQHILNKCLMNDWICKCIERNLRPQIHFHIQWGRKTKVYFLNYWIFIETLLYTRQKEQKQIVQNYFELFQQYRSLHHKKSPFILWLIFMYSFCKCTFTYCIMLYTIKYSKEHLKDQRNQHSFYLCVTKHHPMK